MEMTRHERRKRVEDLDKKSNEEILVRTQPEKLLGNDLTSHHHHHDWHWLAR